jgi:predicted permease
MALALVLLVSSGLMMRTFQSLRRVEPGFTAPEQIQTARISIPRSLVRDPEPVVRMQNQILDKVAAIPGVTSVAFTNEMPMETSGHDWDAVCTDDESLKGSEIPPLRIFKWISPGLFRTAGTRMIAGRDFTWTDVYDRRGVAIVSESLAREKWGSANGALGKRVTTCIPGAPKQEVVGVVQDVRDNGVQEAAPVIMYWPSFGDSLYVPGQLRVERTVTLAIRSRRAGSESLLKQVSQAVWSVNASLPLAAVQTMEDLYKQSMARVSFTLVMLGIAASMALLLGVIGIYGVISYVVSQRQREIGIRLALGAPPRELRRMFVRYGLKLAGAGVAIGCLAAAGLMRLIQGLLFGISPVDPLTYGSVLVVLTVAVVFASYLPARRAASVDPVETLRAE